MRTARLVVLFALFAWFVPAQAQNVGVPIKRGVITVDAAPTGDCSAVPGQVRRVRDTGVTYICENGSWHRRDLPPCDPDPPSGSCSGEAVCLSESEASLYLCVGGAWTKVSSGGTGDMSKSTYDADDDATVDAAEGLAAVSAWAVRYEDRDTDGDGTIDMRIVGDYDGDGTLEWIDDVIQGFVDWCAPGATLDCSSGGPSECVVTESDHAQRKLPLDINGDGTANDPWCGTFVILPGRYRTANGERFFRTNYTGYTVKAYGVVVDESDVMCDELNVSYGASELSPWKIYVQKSDNMYGHTSPVAFYGLTIKGYGSRADLDPSCNLGSETESCSGGDWCPRGWMNGLWAEGVDDYTVKDYVALDIDRQGLDIESGDNVYMENVTVHGSGEHCLAIARNSYSTVFHAELSNCGGINGGTRGDGLVWIGDSSTYRDRDTFGAWVKDIVIRDSNHGIHTEQLNERLAAQFTVEDYVCKDVDEFCADIDTGTDVDSIYSQVTLKNVYIEGGHSPMIDVAVSSYTSKPHIEHLLIDNVHISDGSFDGTAEQSPGNIAISAGGQDVTIRNCVVKDTSGHIERGIYLQRGDNVSVVDNDFYLSAANGMFVRYTLEPNDGSTLIVQRNKFVANGSSMTGLYLGQDASHKFSSITIGDNVFSEDGGTFAVAIDAKYAGNIMISGNDISASASASNTFGVYTHYDADIVSLVGNIIRASNGTTTRAANIRDAAKVIAIGNWFESSGNWIRATEATSGLIASNAGAATSTPYVLPSGNKIPVLDFDATAGDVITARPGVRFFPAASSPSTCDADHEGSVYYDSDLNELCFCNGTSWQQVDGGGGC